jgi:2'-5' RNA ligase
MRLFVAVDVTDEVRGRALLVRERLGRAAGRIRWERPEKLHLTLRFLGDTAEDRLPAVLAAVERTAGSAAAGEVEFGGLGVFPDRGMPRVLWIGARDVGGRLTALAEAMEAAAVELGYPPERRSFTPHLTVARVEFVPRGTDLVGMMPEADTALRASQPVTSTVVYRSELRRSGSEYVKLAQFELKVPS